jgi:rhamnose transport system permease protein
MRNKINFSGLLSDIFKRREFGIFLIIISLVIIVSIKNPRFLSLGNIEDIFLYISILSFIAIGQMMVIITGGIDLSVGSILAFSGMSVGMLMMKYTWIHPIILILIGAAIGLILGFINGLIVGKGKVPPIITTLGTMAIFRGLVLVVSGSQWVDSHEMTRGFKLIARGKILGINNLIFIAIVFAIIFYYFLDHTRKGREIYAYGGNKEAARFVGINAEKVNFLVFSISGALAGFGGVLWVSRFATAQSGTATGVEILVIAACIIGGVSIFGGVGTILGVLLGSLLLGIILNSLELIGVSAFWKLAIQGFVMLVAVIIDTSLSRHTQEGLRKSRRIFIKEVVNASRREH